VKRAFLIVILGGVLWPASGQLSLAQYPSQGPPGYDPRMQQQPYQAYDPRMQQPGYPSMPPGYDPRMQQPGFPSMQPGYDPRMQQPGFPGMPPGYDPRMQQPGFPGMPPAYDPRMQQPGYPGMPPGYDPRMQGAPGMYNPQTWNRYSGVAPGQPWTNDPGPALQPPTSTQSLPGTQGPAGNQPGSGGRIEMPSTMSGPALTPLSPIVPAPLGPTTGEPPSVGPELPVAPLTVRPGPALIETGPDSQVMPPHPPASPPVNTGPFTPSYTPPAPTWRDGSGGGSGVLPWLGNVLHPLWAHGNSPTSDIAPGECYPMGWTFQVLGGYYTNAGQLSYSYAPITFRVGKILNCGIEEGGLRGFLEPILEVKGGPSFSIGHGFVGGSALLRYNFVQPQCRIVPYIQAGVGLQYNDAYVDNSQNALGQGLEYTAQGQIGLRYFVTHNLSLDVEAGYEYITNLGQSARNGGINGVGGSVGLTYYFPCGRR
jgi:Lipid A 3-O-deacylase (PagL)